MAPLGSSFYEPRLTNAKQRWVNMDKVQVCNFARTTMNGKACSSYLIALTPSGFGLFYLLPDPSASHGFGRHAYDQKNSHNW